MVDALNAAAALGPQTYAKEREALVEQVLRTRPGRKSM